MQKLNSRYDIVLHVRKIITKYLVCAGEIWRTVFMKTSKMPILCDEHHMENSSLPKIENMCKISWASKQFRLNRDTKKVKTRLPK